MSQKNSGAACVILDGSLTVRGIDDVQTRLAAALRQHNVVTVDCNSATEIDLSLIQLLLAAHASATHAGKTLRLAAPAAGALHAGLVTGGFLTDGAAAAFWNGSDAPS